jgi:N-terminal half of MaoC dehydratase
LAAIPFTMDVEAGKIREFARATGASHPDYLDGERPVSPPTFLMAAAFWQGPESSPWRGVERDLARVLHGAQEFVFHGEPPAAGTRLVGRSRVGETYTKQGKRGGEMTFTDVVTEYHDSDGRPVATVTSTTITTSRPTGAGA